MQKLYQTVYIVYIQISAYTKTLADLVQYGMLWYGMLWYGINKASVCDAKTTT